MVTGILNLPAVFASALLLLAAATSAHALQDADLSTAPALRLVEELRIGSVNDPNIGFAAIAQVAVDRDGQIYVFESRDRQIRVYSPTGQLLRTIGRSGSGPGEFQGVGYFGVKGDTVWALGARGPNADIFLFSRTGALLSTFRSAGVSAPGRGSSRLLLQPAFMRADGNLVSGGHLITNMRGAQPTGIGPTDTLRIPRVLFNTQGAPIDTAMWELEPPAPARPAATSITISGDRYLVPRALADANLVVRTADGRIVIERSAPQSAAQALLRVTREGLTGNVIFRKSFRYRPLSYSPALMDSMAVRALRGAAIIIDGVIQQNAPADLSVGLPLMRRAMLLPQFQPPVQTAFAGDDGALWLRREDDGTPLQRWELLDAQGNHRGHISVPARLRLVWGSGDTVLAVLPDSDDVPWLIRYRLSR